MLNFIIFRRIFAVFYFWQVSFCKFSFETEAVKRQKYQKLIFFGRLLKMAYGIFQQLLFNLLHMAIVDKSDLTDSSAEEGLELLREQTLELCELCQNLDRDIKFSSTFAPGYLVKEFGEWKIAVPWPLVDEFPDDKSLEEFCKFALSARVGKDSSVCISGSSARAGAIPEIGDIDFAEYVFDEKSELPVRFATTLRSDNDKCFSVEAKLFRGGRSEVIHFTEYSQKKFEELLNIYPDFFSGLSTMQSKIDFIGKSDDFGYIPVTNMIFPSENSELKTGVSGNSFSFQEAVIIFSDTSKTRIWPLLNISEMIKYLEFLVADASKYISIRPMKAVKRASALSRFLYLHEHDVKFAKLLKSEYARNDALISRHEEVERMLDCLPAFNDRAAQIRFSLQVFKDKQSSLCDSKVDEGLCGASVESLICDLISRLDQIDPKLGDHFRATTLVADARGNV